MRSWIMHACHDNASCHLGVAHTLSMLERFYWWIGLGVAHTLSMLERFYWWIGLNEST